jgi:hypothetical protein
MLKYVKDLHVTPDQQYKTMGRKKSPPTKVVSCRISGKVHSKRISLEKWAEIKKQAHFLSISFSECLRIHFVSIILN